MSNDRISDDELNISADTRERLGGDSYQEQVRVAPVRGVSAIKGVFAKENRKRLGLYVCLILLFVGAFIWVYSRLTHEDALKGGIGKVNSNPILTDKNAVPTQAQRDEADRYNQVELAQVQEDNPNAHPVIVTSPETDGGFHKASSFSRPGKISEVGSTTENGGRIQHAGEQGGGQRAVVNYKPTDDLIQGLIEAEGVVTPKAYTVAWEYQQPAATKVSATKDGGAVRSSQTTSDLKCTDPATRAASMYMGTADIALNSDVGGPVSATIRSGRLRGMQVLGKFERKEEWLRIELNKLVTPQKTVPIEAIALDMDTTLNAVQGDLDSHNLYRYGWWGFGTVLKAVGKASEMNADQSVVISNGTALQTTKADTSRELKVAIGSLGQDIGDVFRDRISRPPTVSLKVNDEIGIFFLDDVCLPTQAKGY